jgi:2-polyprenyl-3-methyl-5-hydroxy-6-metoxy-1,4-benzoquinol methylase
MQKKYTLREFLDIVKTKNMFQAKFLADSLADITGEEIAGFENLLNFYVRRGNTLEQVVDKYLNKVEFIMEEQRYFVENGKYRFSTFAEVESYYGDSNYMDSYTIGLGLSTYLWRVHRELRKLFVKSLNMAAANGTGQKYLEIGPGHGEYFVTAMQQSCFQQYVAIDISETSVKLTKDYVEYSMPDADSRYEVIHQDVFMYEPSEPFDMAVMGEVLEHVENPNDFLRRIHRLASNDAYIFVTTAVNAPSPDHIFLFNNLAEVTNLLEAEKFTIIDSVAVNAGNISLEKAEKRKMAVNAGFILKKNN